MQRFQSEQWIPWPLEEVFAFFAQPGNLPLLMPPELDTRVERLALVAALEGFEAGAGSEIEISFQPVPFLLLRVRWTARIVAFAAREFFLDEQVRGPFALFRHRHGFVAETRAGVAGTVVRDDVEFALPLGALGRLGEPIALRQIKAMFAARQQRLPELLTRC
jgi:ligand-binding SRPBCC domain-containing protein